MKEGDQEWDRGCELNRVGTIGNHRHACPQQRLAGAQPGSPLCVCASDHHQWALPTGWWSFGSCSCTPPCWWFTFEPAALLFVCRLCPSSVASMGCCCAPFLLLAQLVVGPSKRCFTQLQAHHHHHPCGESEKARPSYALDPSRELRKRSWLWQYVGCLVHGLGPPPAPKNAHRGTRSRGVRYITRARLSSVHITDDPFPQPRRAHLFAQNEG